MATGRTRYRLMLWLFPVLALAAPMWQAFSRLSVPLFAAESLMLFGAILGVGVALGATVVVFAPEAAPVSGSHRWSELKFVAALVATTLVIIDVTAGGHRVLSVLPGGGWSRLGMLIGVSAALALLHWRLRHHAARILFLVSVVFFIATVVTNPLVLSAGADAIHPADKLVVADRGAPPVIYVVLDGAMGIEGLLGEPVATPLAERLRDMFLRHGFRLYGKAFSRHFVSARSIPDTINFDVQDVTWGPLLRHHRDLKVDSTLFERLSQDGYLVVSYATRHIDFCFSFAVRCETLPSFNPFSPYLSGATRRSTALLEVMRHAFSESYLIYKTAGWVLARGTTGPAPTFVALDAYAFPRWFDRFESDVLAALPGRAYFAHILMPHAPYVLDAACRETGRSTSAYFLLEELHLTGPAFEAKRNAAYADYAQQYACLAGRLEDFLTHIDQSPQLAHATLVFHGDHGSRISSGQYAEHLSDRDMVSNYSALYAIRAPSVVPGYDLRTTSVQRLTAEYFGGPEAPLGVDDGLVVIDADADGAVVTRRMPAFGSRAAD